MNEGLAAAIVLDNEVQDDKAFKDVDEEINSPFDLPPNIALVGFAPRDPRTLDKVLRGPDAKQWQEALDYEIGQLEKLGTWEVVDLPPGQTPNHVAKLSR